nr:ATP-binding protein [uncultured Lachnoclostridium sp.]
MIQNIHIQNFKSISDLTLNCNERFNVLIGKNNIGKTSIFEAIHLWKMCYDWNTKKNKKGFYSTAKNITFSDMEFLRSYTDSAIFPTNCDLNRTTCSITLSIKLDNDVFELGFNICKVASIDDAYYQIEYKDATQFKNFSSKVEQMHQFNLSNIIIINESRPIANIIVKEPYMYRPQVLEKMSKGKGYEVLRNKITKSTTHMEKVQEHISNVMQQSYVFNEVDRENRTYIRLNVNNTDILSQGSGFLQIAEIFSSLEYLDSGINILLIDEPDSHIHVQLQKRLLTELRTINNSQLFVITHNERFLSDIDENEIRFISENIKNGGTVSSLPHGCKGIVLENLVGVLNNVDSLRYANKLLLLEGKTDKEFFDHMIPIYEQFSDTNIQSVYIDKMDGIDTLNNKLLVYSRALRDIVSDTCEWIILRDTDCIPISRQSDVEHNHLGYIRTKETNNKHIYFQNGYGIESTFVSEPNKLAKLLCTYYQINYSEIDHIVSIIQNLNANYATRVKNITDPLNIEFETHFNRQKVDRKEPIYNNLAFRDILNEIDASKVQYIMTKDILDTYLSDIHNILAQQYNFTEPALTNKTIFDIYFNSISCLDDIFESHINLINYLL